MTRRFYDDPIYSGLIKNIQSWISAYWFPISSPYVNNSVTEISIGPSQTYKTYANIQIAQIKYDPFTIARESWRRLFKLMSWTRSLIGWLAKELSNSATNRSVMYKSGRSLSVCRQSFFKVNDLVGKACFFKAIKWTVNQYQNADQSERPL